MVMFFALFFSMTKFESHLLKKFSFNATKKKNSSLLKSDEMSDENFYEYFKNENNTKHNNRMKNKILTYPDLTRIKSHFSLTNSNDKELITT